MSSSEKGSTNIDWCSHREDFQLNYAPQNISARKYLTDQGLNVNSGRRQFGAIAKLEEQGLTYEEIREQLFGGVKSTQRSGSRSTAKSGSTARGSTKPKADPVDRKRQRRSTPPDEKIKEIKEVARGKANGLAVSENERSKKRARLTNPLQQAFIDKSSDAQIGNGGKFTKGNTAAVRTCGYMDLVHADSAIVERVLDTALGDVSGIVQLSTVRYVQMEVMLADRMLEIERLAEEGKLPRDHNNNEISKEDLLREAIWGSSPVITGLLGTLAMARTQASKAAIDNEVKLTRLERERADREFLIALYEKHSADEESTALDIAKQIEARGLKPPPIIVAQALKEIELMTPKVDTSGITDEELDAEVAKYAEHTRTKVIEVISRKAELEKLMLESKAAIENAGLGEDAFNGAFTGMEREELDHDFHSDDFEDDEDSDTWGVPQD